MVDFLTLAREKLTASRTYFVRTDGSDANTGLVNNAGGAFLTIQQAINTVAGLDIGTQNVTIQVADGTYTGTVVVNGPWLGSGTVSLLGNTATPANALISVTANSAVTLQNSATLTIKGFKVAATGGFNAALRAISGSALTFDKIDFGAAARQLQVSQCGSISCVPSATYTISGGGSSHYFASGGGNLVIETATVTLTGTPAFSTAFTSCSNNGTGFLDNNTYSGLATGPRYSAVGNGVIATAGGGASYFPGDSAGSTATGGQYL